MITCLTVNFKTVHKPSNIIRCPLKRIGIKYLMRMELNTLLKFMIYLMMFSTLIEEVMRGITVVNVVPASILLGRQILQTYLIQIVGLRYGLCILVFNYPLETSYAQKFSSFLPQQSFVPGIPIFVPPCPDLDVLDALARKI